MKIHFKFHPSRKNKHIPSNFNPSLSEYWQRQYYDMFRRWR